MFRKFNMIVLMPTGTDLMQMVPLAPMFTREAVRDEMSRRQVRFERVMRDEDRNILVITAPRSA
jgi:hypothetical protein